MNFFDKFRFDAKSRQFILSDSGRLRIVFNDFELNFGMTRLSLQLGRIHPEKAINTDNAVNYPVILWGKGSSRNISLSVPAGKICATQVNDAILLSYANDIGEKNFSPDKAVCMTISQLPGVKKGVFFHNRSNEFQNFDCEGLWWSQAVFVDDLISELSHDWGMLSCWQYDDGLVAGTLAVTTDKVLGRMRGSHKEGLSIISCTGTSGEAIDNYPLALIAFSDSIDELTDKLFIAANALYPNFSLRNEDKLPRPFDKLGWCSWNAFGSDVAEADIKNTIDHFKSDKVPVSYIILDDGWLDIEKAEEDEKLGEGISVSYLNSCEPNREKFPDGLKKLIEYAKDSGIESFGLWHALNGHWQGILPEAPIVKDHPDWFITTKGGWVIPAPNSGFYEAWYEKLKKWGVDFLKIDNQGFHRQCLPYQRNIPEYMAGIQKDVRNAAQKYGFPIIYCMATHPETFFNCGPNQLMRVSNDFIPDDSFGSRKHLVNNFYNSFWLSKILWPDFDMFQTNDIHAETFARMLAISGSPIYTTDKPEQINSGLLRRMVLPSGQIPVYDDLAQVLPSRFFDNPYAKGNILAVSAKKYGITTLGLFNTIETGQSCSGQITLKELGFNESCLIYSDAGQFVPQVIKPEKSIRFSLKNMESDLISVAPIENGFALIGVVDFFAAPAIIENIECCNGTWAISLLQAGTLTGFCREEPVSITCGNEKLQRVVNQPSPGQYNWDKGILKIATTNSTIEINI